eukprot:Skav203659  [mRNA]  locus=scaffold2755:67102:70040:- [translate_table: standard]
MTAAIPPLNDVADQAAASQQVRDYLTARGILTTGTLALIASDETTFKTTVIDPLLSGWRQSGASIVLAEAEKPIATAMLLHMWGVCRRYWVTAMTPAAPTSPSSATTTAAAKSSADDKVPKTLPAGVWGQLVMAYNSIQLDGRDRSFPTQVVLGAESILARMWHEHQHSKMYTPLLLGEILQHRSFQSSGEVNPLAKQQRKSSSLKLEDGCLIEQDEKGWEPRSVLAVLDGLEAVRWATVLTQLGPEQDVHRYIDWMVQRVRCRPNKTEQFNAYWTACAWKIAMGMREGQTYTHLVDTVMKDFDRFADFMSREETTPKKPSSGSKGKGTVALTPKLNTTGKEIILLGFFDGIGSAAFALQSVVGTVKAYLSWETDADCIRVITHHFPHAVHRGDLTADTPAAVAALIKEIDSEGRCIVVTASGPPCPDFSSIAESAQGRAGTEGRKFVSLTEFLKDLEPLLNPREVSHITENVVMANHGDVQYFTTALKSEPVVFDAADFGLINRPRIFWCRINWKTLRTNPLTGKPLRWSRHHRLPRLHLDIPYTNSEDLALGDLTLPPAVAHHHTRLPCLTTPAPTDEGRPPPKKLRGRVDSAVRQRWLQDNRTYAPWHYSEGAMLRAPDGTLHTPPAEVKEQLHGFPPGYTAVHDVPLRARHRMLANSWHVGVARFIFLCLLTQWGAMSGPTPPPTRTALQYVLELASCEETYVGSGMWTTFATTKEPTYGMMDHWHASSRAGHPLTSPPHLEPGLDQVIAKQRLIGDLPRLRREVVAAVADWVTDSVESTSHWMQQRPAHIQAVYCLEDGSWVQVPILLSLLEMIAYPGINDLRHDLSQGFPVLGRLNAGSGLHPSQALQTKS